MATGGPAEATRVCLACGEENPARARFCLACAKPLVGAESEVEETRKTVSVVFTDLVGSTALQEALDPESVRHVMGRFYAVMRHEVEDAGGRVEKFIGDAVVAVFGAPAVREDDALRAVRAAAAMSNGLAVLNEELDERWGVRLGMRTGVNTGEVVISREGFMVGDVMNLAARLEQAAPAGEVLVGAETARLVRHDVQLEEIAPLTLKGKSGTVAAYRLVDAAAAAPEDHAALEVPLIGREAELEQLQGVYQAALDSHACRLATVIASPGLGKTRLAHEFAAREANQAVILEARCEGGGQGTFAPVAEMTRDAAGIAETATPESVRDRLREFFDGQTDAASVIERLEGVLGLATPFASEETFWAVRRLLETAAADRAAIVLIDDAHWAEPTFLDLIEYLVAWVRDAAVALVVLARPELRDLRSTLVDADGPSAGVVALVPLAEDESGRLVASLLGEADLPPGLLAQVLQTTEGNPLFLGEMLRMLVDDGVLRRNGDTWAVAAGAAVEVPPTINALLAARIDRLRSEERTVIERASVIGKQFYRGAVVDLVPVAVGAGIDGHLEALRRKDFVEPEGTVFVDEPVFRFHHVLIRDAAYRTLLKESRAELHERFADWLEKKAGALVGEHEEAIAFHLEQAHSYRAELGPLDDRGRELGVRAAARLRSAARRALGREDLPAAGGLLERALARLEQDDADRVEALVDLCEARISAGDTVAGGSAVSELRTRADGPRLTALATVYEGELANLTDRSHLHEVEEGLAGAAEVLSGVDDLHGAAKGHHVRAQTLALLGRVGDAEAALDQALGTARQAGDDRRARAVLAGAPRAALWGPSPLPRASGRCLDVVRILRMRSGVRHVEAVALRCQAVLEAMRGRIEPAREILRTCRAMLEELGLTFELLETATHAGIVELIAGDPVAAEAELRGAYEGFTRLGADAGAAQAAALLARALLERGAHTEAEELTHVSEERGGEDLKTTVAWCSVRAEILAARGEHEEADRLATRAVDLAAATDALIDHADARMSRAAVLRAAGRSDDARAEVDRAARLYARKESSAGLARAQTFGGDDQHPVTDSASADLATDVERLDLAHRPAALARMYERALIDGTPEWAPIDRFYAALNGRDWDALADVLTEDFVRVDHTRHAWEQMDRAAFVETWRNVGETAPSFSATYEPLDRLGDSLLYRFSAEIGEVAGADSAGGGTMIACMAVVAREGRIARFDAFDDEDEARARARMRQLADGGVASFHGPDATSGDIGTSEEHHRAETLIGRWAERWNAHETDRLVDELVHPDAIERDTRAVSAPDLVGRDAFREMYAMIHEISPHVGARLGLLVASSNTLAWNSRLTIDLEAENTGEGQLDLFVVAHLRDDLIFRSWVLDDETAALALHRRVRETATGTEPSDLAARLDGLAVDGGSSISDDDDQVSVASRLVAGLNARDWDAVGDAVTDEIQMVDHRPGSPVGALSGREIYIDFQKAAVAISTDVRWSAETDVTAGSLSAGTLTVAGTYDDGGGAWANRMGCLVAIDDSRMAGIELFPESDSLGLITRLEELAAEGPALSLFAIRYVKALGSGDVEALRPFLDDDVVLSDHRAGSPLSASTGVDEYLDLLGSSLGVADDLRVSLEILEDRGDLCLAHIRHDGRWREGGGQYMSEILLLAAAGLGGVRSFEVFAPEDEAAARARLNQLAAGQAGRPGDAKNEPSGSGADMTERFPAALNARDWEAVAALVNEDVVIVDHRPGSPVGTINGREAYVNFYKSAVAISADVEWVADLQFARGRVIVGSLTVSGTLDDGGGAWCNVMRCRIELEDGLVTRGEIFPEDTRDAALAVGGDLDPSESLDLGRRWVDAHNTRDWEAMKALMWPDTLLIDHRKGLGGGETVAGRDAVVERNITAVELVPDLHSEQETVLFDVDGGIVRQVGVGHLAQGGGEVRLEFLSMIVVRDGLACRAELFDLEDLDTAKDRFRELTGAHDER